MSQAAATVDGVLDLLRQWGEDHYDEALSQIDHALQSAALAEAQGAADALVAAALLHDVGHLLDLESGRIEGSVPEQDLAHEATGARWLAPLFPPSVTAPIALHVRAKRYLCAVDRDYVDLLTPGSRSSLQRQGGPMDAREVAAFESLAGADDAVALRRWDDHGKVEGLTVPPLEHYRPLLERLSVDA